MIKGQNIICISSIDWEFIWQGHQEIMAALARNGNNVLFIENTGIRAARLSDLSRLKKRYINWSKGTKGFRQEMPNLYIYSPLLLPFPYSRFARWINRRLWQPALSRWMKAMEFHDPIIWTFLPTGTALDIINNINRKLLVYYYIADFQKLVDDPLKVRRSEDVLIKMSDIVFVQCRAFENRCKNLNKNVHIFPFGVNVEAFTGIQDSGIPGDIRNIRKPVLGYIGGIHRHIDLGLIKFLAKSHPEWSIVLIGPLQADASEIASMNNVFLLGKKEFPRLSEYIRQFDVGIIPYEINEYTKTVFPTKLNEYHIMGKPVVSTDLPEIRFFNTDNKNLVLIGKSYQDFADCVSKALSEEGEELKRLREFSARKNSWPERIEEMSSLLEEALAGKFFLNRDWKARLTGFYKTAKRKVVSISSLIIFVYLLLFYTPLVWILAEPLKIYRNAEKADCIVVFAGGVGESGKAGQGYEERVGHAVNLYRKGFADKIIFSSGYKYLFKEPLLMKALAVSLGVPEDAIILEDSAANTYENVKYSEKILRRYGYKRILLVSSPYHMKRALLVFRKTGPSLEVIPTPVPDSLFYSRGKGNRYGRNSWGVIKWGQIRAILHEYLGIVYYKLRGYI